MNEKLILLSGRPGSGKTELIICYANKYPKSTLFLVEEYSPTIIYKRGLDKSIKVINLDEFNSIELSTFKTICIDYIELFNTSILKLVIKKCINQNVRIIGLTQMRRDFKVNNIFEELDY